MSERIKRRLEQLERRRRAPELPPLIIRESISPEEFRHLERESIQKYGAPCLIITLKRPDLSILRGESD